MCLLWYGVLAYGHYNTIYIAIKGNYCYIVYHIQVFRNGAIGIRPRFGLGPPQGLSLRYFASQFNRQLVAPFYDDIDTSAGGDITYRLILNDNDTFNTIQQEISEQYPELGDARPSLVCLATWYRVPPYHSIATPNNCNSFQVYIATNGTWSVVKFSYGIIQWATTSTLIGVSGDRAGLHITHPATRNIGALQQLRGSSVFYRIDDGTLLQLLHSSYLTTVQYCI